MKFPWTKKPYSPAQALQQMAPAPPPKPEPVACMTCHFYMEPWAAQVVEIQEEDLPFPVRAVAKQYYCQTHKKPYDIVRTTRGVAVYPAGGRRSETEYLVRVPAVPARVIRVFEDGTEWNTEPPKLRVPRAKTATTTSSAGSSTTSGKRSSRRS